MKLQGGYSEPVAGVLPLWIAIESGISRGFVDVVMAGAAVSAGSL